MAYNTMEKPQVMKTVLLTGAVGTLLVGMCGCVRPSLESDNVAAAVESTMTALAAEATTAPSLDELIPPRGHYEHDQYEVTEEYDRFDEVTNVFLTPKPGTTRSTPRILVVYDYEGTEPARPPTVGFGTMSESESWEYLDCHNLVLLLDDEVRIRSDAEHHGEVGTGYVLEWVVDEFSVSQFLQIVNANKVEVKVCNTEFELDLGAKEALRDVASRMRPK